MTDVKQPEPPQNLWTIFVVGSVIAISVCFSAVAGSLVFGWISFVTLRAKQIEIRWDFILIGLIALGLLTLSLRSLSQRVSATKMAWLSSLRMTMLLVVAFIAGTAMVGGVHQTAWILTRREPRVAELNQPALWEIPLVSDARRSALQSQWRNQLRNVGVDLSNYHSMYGTFREGGVFDEEGRGVKGWGISMLPMMWYSDWHDTETWRDPHNSKQCKCLLPDFIRPDADQSKLFDEDGYGLSQLAGNVHVLGINRKMSLEEISDGTANPGVIRRMCVIRQTVLIAYPGGSVDLSSTAGQALSSAMGV